MADGTTVVVVAGGNGVLGRLIVEELIKLGAAVVILTRKGRSPSAKSNFLAAEVREVDFDSIDDLMSSLKGVDVVVSALAGLHDVIVDAQGRLIRAAASAGVLKFVPSDFSIDFRQIPNGENRNLNLRKEFYERYEDVPIKKTSVLNGAFTGMLTGTAPFVLFTPRRILCWGDPKQKMDWTTIEDTARYTAHAALDLDSPRFLRIAGDQISAEDLSNIMSDLTGIGHRVLNPGGLCVLRMLIRLTKFFIPGEHEIYPPWQGMQYMYNMHSGLVKFDAIDNERYPIVFRSAKDVLNEHLRKCE